MTTTATTATTVRAHSGHAGESGIQRHSCGPDFPWYAVGNGNFHQWYNGATGELAGPWVPDCLKLEPRGYLEPYRTPRVGWRYQFQLGGIGSDQWLYRARGVEIDGERKTAWHTADNYNTVADSVDDSILEIAKRDKPAPQSAINSLNAFSILLPLRDNDKQSLADELSAVRGEIARKYGSYTIRTGVYGEWVDVATGTRYTDSLWELTIATSDSSVSQQWLRGIGRKLRQLELAVFIAGKLVLVNCRD